MSDGNAMSIGYGDSDNPLRSGGPARAWYAEPLDAEAEARERRARVRRETWRVEALSDAPPKPADSLDERLEQMERLRRIGFALAGVPYPEGPTPRHERQKWPLTRID